MAVGRNERGATPTRAGTWCTRPSGVLSVHTERGTSIVPANRVAWTPAGFTHYHRAHGQTDMRILFLPASLARLVPGHPAVFTVSDLAREVLLALTGPRNYDGAAPGWDRAARARLRRVLVDELRAAPEQPLQLPEPRDDRLRAVARRLYEQPGDSTSLAELGRAAGASARTLSRLFHDELGMTFYQWRTQLRVYHALVLLADGHDTTHVAYACGWANPSSFIAAFTAIVGTTPGRYRTSRSEALTREHWGTGSGDGGGSGAARDPAGEQAAAEERALQGPVAVHAAAAEAGRLARRVEAGHRLPGGGQHPGGQVGVQAAEALAGQHVQPDRDQRAGRRVEQRVRLGDAHEPVAQVGTCPPDGRHLRVLAERAGGVRVPGHDLLADGVKRERRLAAGERVHLARPGHAATRR